VLRLGNFLPDSVYLRMSRIPHDSRTASDAAESCAGLGGNFHPLNQTSLCFLEKERNIQRMKNEMRMRNERE
jgi:hypothetical protein